MTQSDTPASAPNPPPAHSRCIGVILPDLSNPVHSEAASRIRALAAQNGYAVLTENAAGDLDRERLCMVKLLEAGVRGLVTMPVSAAAHPLYVNAPVPCVLLGSRTEEESLDYVVQDDYHAAYLVVARLAACGRHSIAFLAFPGAQGYSALDRKNGVLKAVRRCETADLHVETVELASEQLADSFAGAARLLASPVRPSAIVAQNDYIAYGALEAVAAAGLAPGRDVAVIGFDDLSLSSLPKIQLSTVTTVGGTVAERTFALLLRRMTQGRGAGRCGVLLAPRLVFRASFPGGAGV